MKQKYDVIQSGENPNYPKEAYIWSLGNPIPEWLSDRAYVKEINSETGEISLETRERSNGEIEILEAGGRNVLVCLKTRESFILFSKTHPLLSVTPHQLELLYELHFRI